MEQKELADKLGCGVATVSSWETGARIPNSHWRKQLAQFFKVSEGYLLGEDAPKGMPKEGAPAPGFYPVVGASIQVKPKLEVVAEPQKGELLFRLTVELIPLQAPTEGT